MIGYAQAHKNVRRERGRASEYDCVDCGGRAREWSLRAGRGVLVADSFRYSIDPADYDPRCRSCHRKYDGASVGDRNPFHRLRFDRAGEANTQAKLTDADCETIRRMHASGRSQRGVAELYGVHPSTISLIVNGKRRPTSLTQS